MRPRAPPLDDARPLSVSAGDQLPQRRKLPQVSNSKNAKKTWKNCFADGHSSGYAMCTSEWTARRTLDTRHPSSLRDARRTALAQLVGMTPDRPHLCQGRRRLQCCACHMFCTSRRRRSRCGYSSIETGGGGRLPYLSVEARRQVLGVLAGFTMACVWTPPTT